MVGDIWGMDGSNLLVVRTTKAVSIDTSTIDNSGSVRGGASTGDGTDIAKLNDTIAKLTATVDRLNQQLAERDRPAKPSGSSSSSSLPTSNTARRQDIYARQTWRPPLWWREPVCSW